MPGYQSAATWDSPRSSSGSKALPGQARSRSTALPATKMEVRFRTQQVSQLDHSSPFPCSAPSPRTLCGTHPVLEGCRQEQHHPDWPWGEWHLVKDGQQDQDTPSEAGLVQLGSRAD